jgi:hypothetical protein
MDELADNASRFVPSTGHGAESLTVVFVMIATTGHGELIIRDEYRPDLPAALKHIEIFIRPGAPHRRQRSMEVGRACHDVQSGR